jgi:hypothetical protein
VTADIEEGAAVAEAVLETGEVVVDAIDGAEPQARPKATFSPRVMEIPAGTSLQLLSHVAPWWAPTVVVF